jgi:uncharacterized protein (TIGR00251 family)
MAALLEIKVRARSKEPGVEKLADRSFLVRVAAPPDRGRANREVLERLADFLDVPPSRLKIVQGETSSSKRIRFEP